MDAFKTYQDENATQAINLPIDVPSSAVLFTIVVINLLLLFPNKDDDLARKPPCPKADIIFTKINDHIIINFQAVGPKFSSSMDGDHFDFNFLSMQNENIKY